MFKLMVSLLLMINTLCAMETQLIKSTASKRNQQEKQTTTFKNSTNIIYYLRFRDSDGKNLISNISGNENMKFPQDEEGPFYIQLNPHEVVTLKNANEEMSHVRVWRYRNLISFEKSSGSILNMQWKNNNAYELRSHKLRLSPEKIYPIVCIYSGKKLVALQNQMQVKQDSAMEEIALPNDIATIKEQGFDGEFMLVPEKTATYPFTQTATKKIDQSNKKKNNN